jgi:hypothetical protein
MLQGKVALFLTAASYCFKNLGGSSKIECQTLELDKGSNDNTVNIRQILD